MCRNEHKKKRDPQLPLKNILNRVFCLEYHILQFLPNLCTIVGPRGND